MQQDVKLPFFPSIQDCIVWSADGDIAIAAGDTVHIASPRTICKAFSAQTVDPTSQTNHTDDWELSCFKTNESLSEAPGLGDAGFNTFSIGEEQSAALISCIGWSPPGIARYRRCVLAVLSTTHVLSLFEPPASSPLPGDWRRVLVVNTAVKAYFRHSKTGSVGDRLRRLRGRIRAFSWSHEQRFEGRGSRPDGSTNQYYLALANEYNEIVFARVYFDGHTAATPSGEWRAQIIGHMRAQPEDALGMNFEPCLPNRPDRFVNKLSWSPWYGTKDGQREAFVAYSTRGELKIMKVSVTAAEYQLSENVDPCDFGFRISDLDVTVASAFSKKYHFRSVAWYEKVWNQKLILAFAAPGSIRVASVTLGLESHSSNEFLEKAIIVKEHPNKYWDSVTGMILRSDPDDSKIMAIHAVTQLTHTFVLSYSLPEATLYSAKSSGEDGESWMQAISFHLASFDSRHNLGGLSLAKTWGLARSPVGGFIAACVTLHPKGMIEYITPNFESCRVVFGMDQELLRYFVEVGEDRAKPKILDLSIEAFVQDARHLEGPMGLGIEQDIRESALKPLDQVWRRLDHALPMDGGGQGIGVGSITYPQTDSPLAVEYAISREIIYNPTLTVSRYQNVIRMIHRYQEQFNLTEPLNSSSASGGGVPYDDVPIEILFHLITSILSVPRKWAEGNRLSTRTLYAAACVGALGLYEVKRILELSEKAFRWLATTEGVNLELELEHCKTRAEAAAAGPMLAGDMRAISFPPRRKDQLEAPGAQAVFEICEMCGECIGWQDIKLARCSNNHVFARCALTFLAIQRLGTSKHCGVCGKEYLHEDITQPEKPSTTGEERAPAESPDAERPSQALPDVDMEAETRNPVPIPSSEESGKAPEQPVVQGQLGTQPSLASLLLAACDVCVYCGGKFRTGSTVGGLP